MMNIVSITEINKQRARISLDTEESFVLYKGEIRMLHLKEGMELSGENYDRIMKGILPKRCKMRAINLLKDRCYTSYSLKKKLLDGGYPEAVAEEALSYVSSFGYVNDLKYAMMYIEDQESKHTIREITQKLLSKGIPVSLTEEALRQLGEEREAYGEQSRGDIENELIEKTLKKRGYTGEESYEDRQKLLAYFYRRGFDTDRVRRVMEDISKDPDN